MTLIRLTRASDGSEVWINPIRIVSVAKAVKDDTTMIDTQCEDGSMYRVAEPINEVVRLVFGDLENPMPVKSLVWAEHPEAMIYRKIGSLEAERDSARRTASISKCETDRLRNKVESLEAEMKKWVEIANRYASGKGGPRLIIDSSDLEDFLQSERETNEHIDSQLKAWEAAANTRSSVKISSPDDLGKCIAELESQLKAWQEAASVDLVENPDEPPTPCQTPEQLVEQLRSLYRWATRAEKDASELRKSISAIIDVITKIPPF